MLSAFRRLAGTWFAKVLFLLLILSFGIWGIEDVVRNFGRETAVAYVGGEPIPLTEAQTAVRRETQRLQRQLGAAFDANDTVRQAIARQTVESLVAQRTQAQEAARLGVSVSTAAVRDYVFAIPAFQAGGQFSRPIFDQFLRGNGVDENTFLGLVSAELRRQQLVGAVRAGVAGPDQLVKPLLASARERRSAELVTLPVADAPEPPAPTEEQLRRFHENEAAQFSAPEYRTATVARLAAEIVAADVTVPEEEIAQAYAAAGARFNTPERRVLEQLLLPDEASARALAQAWSGGESFAALSEQAREKGGQAVELGALDRAGMPFPELAEAAFAAPEGGVAGPVQSPFGWHVLHVSAIQPPSTRTLDEVRDELRGELAQTKAADLAYERVNGAEDALAGGATLEEVARQFGLRVATVTTDVSGRDASGAEVPLPVPDYARTETLAAIFAANRGQPARMAESAAGAGFVGVELREVTPPALRPFEQVETQVRAAWIRDAMFRAEETRAAALLGAVRDGATLEAAAQQAGLTSTRLGPFGRDPAQVPGAQNPPPELLQPLFGAKPLEATMARTAEGYVVAQLLEILPDPGTDEAALAGIRGEVEQAMQEDLEAQYGAALRQRAEVRINQDLMNQVSAP
ncbi:SurA N-terminal domain-containing protein [Roseomonas sp. BN140053]|uniref:SurA N-terminal domain-containing protein n=1 Tax=Roseomonas sp. BN140053 TaxID=3391898 RepID=UPI0039EA0C82